MNSIVYTIIMVALWVLNLFNDSGLGHIYQTIIYLMYVFNSASTYLFSYRGSE